MNGFIQLFQDIFNILTSPPGNIAYHLVLTFAVVGALLTTTNHWRSSQYPQDRRARNGLFLILFLRLVEATLTLLATQGIINEHLPLPPIDRAIALLSLLIIIWIWAFPEPSPPADAATLLVGLLIITYSTLTWIWWSGSAGEFTYNYTPADTVSQVAAIILTACGVLFLLLRKPNGWEFGLGMMLVILIGHSAYLLLPATAGDFPGPIRLAQMIAYPLLLAIPQRFPLASPATMPVAQVSPQERRLYGIDPGLLDSFLALGSETDPGKICQYITQTTSHALLADICLLLYPPTENGEVIVSCGYDLIREEHIDGFTLDTRQAPVIASALRRGLPIRLPASSTSQDLINLKRYLKLERPGHLLAAPLLTDDQAPLCALLLLSPYSERGWTTDDQAVLVGLTGPLAHLLQRINLLDELQNELQSTHEALREAEQETEKIRLHTEKLEVPLQAEGSSGDGIPQAASLAALIIAQEEAQEKISRLRSENQRLRQAILSGNAFTEDDSAGITIAEDTFTADEQEQSASGTDLSQIPSLSETESDHLNAELRLALEEVARLKTMLITADQAMLASGNGTDIYSSEEASAEVASIVRQLRQPMSSIISYTDFLLAETVGILGALQRKFLDRIRVSSMRMNKLVDDLVQITLPESGAIHMIAEPVDLNEIIDQAISQTRGYLREKNIVLRVDIPEGLPELSTDRDALEQVIIHLLENAGEITPTEGEITLRARLQNNDGELSYTLVQIADSGGGIPAEYMPRLFSRVTIPEADPIPGISGKNGNLSIVKMLVENIGGRIWVDSEVEVGATYSILIPATSVEPQGNGAGGAN
jgi:signal transduction histidine kinase